MQTKLKRNESSRGGGGVGISNSQTKKVSKIIKGY